MEQMIAAFLGGSAASALISGLFSLLQDRLRRGKRRSDTEQALVDGMQFILLDVIAQRALRYIQAGEDCATNVPGVFVAGDSRSKELRQLVTAASDGAMAASKAGQYLGAL